MLQISFVQYIICELYNLLLQVGQCQVHITPNHLIMLAVTSGTLNEQHKGAMSMFEYRFHFVYLHNFLCKMNISVCFILFVSILCVCAVSYTHLDVYKRQETIVRIN